MKSVKKIRCVIAFAITVVACVVVAAQAVTPTLDTATAKQVQQLAQNDQNLQRQIAAAGQQMQVVSKLNDQRYANSIEMRLLEGQIEQRYPGYRLDRATGQLVPKPQPQKQIIR
jgi:hypothetical protein